MMLPAETLDTACFVKPILDLVSGLLPPFRILDGCFPSAPFFLCGVETELCYFPENIPDEGESFYARFRQGGGHRAVLPFAEALAAALASDAKTVPLLAFLSSNGRTVAEALKNHEARPPLLILKIDTFDYALPMLRALGYSGYGCFRLVKAEMQESCCLLSADADSATLLAHFDLISRTFAEETRLVEQQGIIQLDCTVAYLPESYRGWETASLVPFNFVHDTQLTHEGDASYSWLWVAGEPHIRILLGTAHARFRRVRVVLCNALSTQNLQGARLLLNGEAVQPLIEVWSETTGAVSADLPETLAGPLVLGLWMPLGQMTEDGMRKIFASIDRIELSV